MILVRLPEVILKSQNVIIIKHPDINYIKIHSLYSLTLAFLLAVCFLKMSILKNMHNLQPSICEIKNYDIIGF